MRIVGVIEARMGSSRCPGKVVEEVVGKPLLQLIIERMQCTRQIDDIVVATSVEQKDEIIKNVAEKAGVYCFRGSENDVRLRVLQAVQSLSGDIIVQIGADQPFPDWNLNDQLIDIYKDGKYDFVSNALQLSYPLGIVAQVYIQQILAEAEAITRGEQSRDGTSDHIWQNPDKYSLYNLIAPPDLHAPEVRLTVDYPEDLKLTKLIYEALYVNNEAFHTGDILALLRAHPDWLNINSHFVHTNRIQWGGSVK